MNWSFAAFPLHCLRRTPFCPNGFTFFFTRNLLVRAPWWPPLSAGVFFRNLHDAARAASVVQPVVWIAAFFILLRAPLSFSLRLVLFPYPHTLEPSHSDKSRGTHVLCRQPFRTFPTPDLVFRFCSKGVLFLFLVRPLFFLKYGSSPGTSVFPPVPQPPFGFWPVIREACLSLLGFFLGDPVGSCEIQVLRGSFLSFLSRQQFHVTPFHLWPVRFPLEPLRGRPSFFFRCCRFSLFPR